MFGFNRKSLAELYVSYVGLLASHKRNSRNACNGTIYLHNIGVKFIRMLIAEEFFTYIVCVVQKIINTATNWHEQLNRMILLKFSKILRNFFLVLRILFFIDVELSMELKIIFYNIIITNDTSLCHVYNIRS